MTRLDGRAAADFDVIDRFLVAHGLDVEVAAEAMALPDERIARMLVDVDVPREELVRLARGLTPAKLARVVGTARPGRADDGVEEAARAARPGQPGACDEPQREPGPPRRRRRRGGAARLRRARDDGRRRALRAAQRPRAARRLADGPPRRDDAVRGRGAAEPRARDPRPRHLRRDPLRLRDRAGVRRRRRHPLVEGVPRLRLRLARGQGAVHLGHGLRGADGARARPLDAVPRGPLHLRRPGRRRPGDPERLDLVRRARARRAGRDARDPRRERPRRVARPRGRVGQRRDRVALGDPQDGEADGPVPPGHGLRDVGLLGHAAARQHLRRRELRRRRHRRVAHDPARLAGRRRHRAGRGGRAPPGPRACRPGDPGGLRRARAPAGDRRGGRGGDTRPWQPRRPGPRPRGRRGGGGRASPARGVGAGRGGRPRRRRLRGRRRGGRGDAPPARRGRLPADGRRDRARRARPLGGQRPERVPRPRHRLPAPGRALGAPAGAPARRRPARRSARATTSPRRSSQRGRRRSPATTRPRS